MEHNITTLLQSCFSECSATSSSDLEVIVTSDPARKADYQIVSCSVLSKNYTRVAIAFLTAHLYVLHKTNVYCPNACPLAI